MIIFVFNFISFVTHLYYLAIFSRQREYVFRLEIEDTNDALYFVCGAIRKTRYDTLFEYAVLHIVCLVINLMAMVLIWIYFYNSVVIEFSVMAILLVFTHFNLRPANPSM